MKQFKKIVCLVLIFSLTFIFSGCGEEDSFKNWNKCDSLDQLTSYVSKVTNTTSSDFIPIEDRIAVFDMDGTLCGELFPEYLEYLLLAYRCLDDPNYQADDDLKNVATLIRESGKNYKTPKVDNFDLVHGRAQAKAFAGLTPSEFISYVKDFLQLDAVGFQNMKYADSLYKPMIDVVKYLVKHQFTCYVVSGSDRMICRAVVCDQLDLPEKQVIGMGVNLVATHQGDKDGLNYQFNSGGEDELVRGDELIIKNLKMNKVQQIVQEIGKQPVLSFGNSSGDVSMHEYTITNNKYKALAFMLIADDNERDHADLEETAKRKASWEEHNYVIISMKNDFKTIYGANVIMTE